MDDTSVLVLHLLSLRAEQATVCPSEVARAIVGKPEAGTTASTWRDAMPVVHAAVDQLVKADAIALSWKGQSMPSRSGPYRIGRAKPQR